MASTSQHRLTALLGALAVVGATIVPAWPAVAADVPPPPTTSSTPDPTGAPTPDPVPTPDPTPTPTSTPDATGAPAPQPTATPEASATPQPSATPDASATPTPTPTPTATPAPASVTFVGTFNRLSGDGEDAESLPLFMVAGHGFLLVDTTGISAADNPNVAVALELAVPEGVVLSDDPDEQFAQLSTYSTDVAPLTVISVAPTRQLSSRHTAAAVTQTPNTPAIHSLYFVLLSPSNMNQDTTYQTDAAAATLTSYVNTYWGNQSSGSIGFVKAGTTVFHRSATTCATDAGSVSLWNEAQTYAASELGYVAGKNTHLVALFPSTANCGGAIGLGTIGGSVNQGGLTWVVGASDLALRKGTLAHELGHNMSLGHADWLQCPATNPVVGASAVIPGTPSTLPGIANCTVRHYGDISDVMGFGSLGATNGALSSAQAIRAGIWPAASWVNADTGTNSYTIAPMTTHTGVRAVVVQDNDGTVYFVEQRTNAGEDAQFAAYGCTDVGGYCTVSGTATVRILRLEPSGYQGAPGFDSYVIGRSGPSIGYGAGQSFWTQGLNNGIKITVTSVSASGATIQVIRPSDTATAGTVVIDSTVARDAQPRVGNTLTAFLGDRWDADDYAYQWNRNGSAIPGATDPSYVVQPADLGTSITVTVTGSIGASSQTVTSGGYGPIVVGIYPAASPGGVTVSNVGGVLTGVPFGYPDGVTTYSYQWFRGATASTATTAIPSAATATYTPTVADRGQFLRLRVAATVPGYTVDYRYSTAKNYDIVVDVAGAVTIAGQPKVASVLTVVNTISYKTTDGPLTPGFTYTWFRNGVAIVGASGPSFATYTPVAADVGTRLSVRVDAFSAGYVTLTGTPSAQVGPVTLAAIPISAPPTISVGATALQASAVAASTSEPGVTGTYQWYRKNPTTLAETLITGATAPTYVPVLADNGQQLMVRLTLTKPGYDVTVRASAAGDFSVIADTTPVVAGAPMVGATLSVADVGYHDPGGNPLAVQRTYQWLRNGVAIAGAVGPSYLVPATDFGVPITVRVTATSAPFAPVVSTAVPTGAIAKGLLTGTLAADVTLGTGLKLTAQPSGVSAPTGTIAYSYQWFRRAGAAAPVLIGTASTYTLVAADYNTTTFVRITASNLNYTSVSADSVPHGYGVIANPVVPVLVGEQRIGVDLVVGPRDYVVDGAPVTPTLTYGWFRDGVAIPGTTGVGDTFRHYTPTALDAGKAITVTVTAAMPGLQSSVAASIPTQKLTAFSLDGWDAALPAVVQTPGTLRLALPGTGVTEPTAVTAYQWLRNGVAITGATASTYTLTSADALALISVRTLTCAPLYTCIAKVSPGVDYSIRPTDPVSVPVISTGAPQWQVGAVGQVDGLAFATRDGPLADPVFAYQWLRNGVAIAAPLGTASTYALTSADLGTAISVRVTASTPGYLPITVTTAAKPAVLKGDLAGSFAAPTVSVGATNLLTAIVPAGAITTPGVTYSYVWYANGSVVVSRAATYQLLTPLDRTRTISVQVTASKAGYTDRVLGTSAPLNYAITTSGSVDIDNLTRLDGENPRVGDTLQAVLPTYSTKDGTLTFPPGMVTYQWYRKSNAVNGTAVAIAGATGATYVVQSADQPSAGVVVIVPGSPVPFLGTASLYVVVTVSAPGYLPIVQTSPQWGPVETGVITGTGAAPTVISSATGLLSAVITPSSIDMPSPAFTYRWMRGTPGSGVVLGTAATYQLTTANAGQTIWLELSASKSKATPATFLFSPSTPIDYTIVATAGSAAIVTPDGIAPRVGDGIVAQVPTSFTDALGTPMSPTFSYQWLRNGIAIAAPLGTVSSYTVTPADLASASTFQVIVTANAPGLVPTRFISAATATTLPGVILTTGGPAAVTLTNPATNDYTASVPAGTIQTSGTTLAYRWYRAGSPNILIGTLATYRLTAADAGKPLFVEVTASRAGFLSTAIVSPAVDYKLHPNATFGITDEDGGAIETGDVLIAGDGLQFLDATNTPVVSTVSYQWYRNGVAIAGATAQRYELSSADLGANVTVTATVRAPGSIPLILPGAGGTGPVVKGPIEGSFVGAAVVPNGPGSLKVSLPAGYLRTSGVTIGYQWYRTVGAAAPVAIPGATASTFTLTSADATADLISARLTFTKPNLTGPAPQDAAGRDPRILLSTPPTITTDPADLKVGRTLTVDPGVFTDAAGVPVTGATIQWMRQVGTAAPIAMIGATAPTYVVQPTDLGATFFARVTPVAPGSIATFVPTTPTGPILAGEFQGSLVAPTVVTTPATNTLTATLTAGSITTPSPVLSYRWLRNGVTLLSTAASYRLVAADSGQRISVQVSVSRTNFLPVTLPESTRVSYSIVVDPGDPPSIVGAAMVGRPLAVDHGTYTDGDAVALASTPTYTYTWYRKAGAAAKVVVGAGATYTPTSADLGANISVLVTITAPGYLPVSTEITPTSAVQPGAFQGALGAPLVTLTPTTNTLTATVPPGTITDPAPTYSYQWLRGGFPIPGATAATYKLTTADADGSLQVRVTVTKVGYTPVVLPESPAESYGISLTGAPAIEGSMQVGTTVSLNSSALLWELRGSTITPTLKYEWMRGSTLVGTAATYLLQPADVGAQISLRITPIFPGGVFARVGVLPAGTMTTGARTGVAGAYTGTAVAVVSITKPTMTLTAALQPGSVTETGLTLTYQWLRNGLNIPGAITSSYKIVDPTDRAKDIAVRITYSKPGYPTLSVQSNPTSYTLQAALTVGITPSSTPAVGDILQLTSAGYLTTPGSVTYQWYRKTGSAAAVPIVGTLGTGAAYIVTAADTGSSLYAVVTGALAGYLPDIQTTAPIAVPGVPWTGSLAMPTVTMTNVATLTLTATVPAGSITSTPYASAWQWYRGATPIPGATLATYTVTTADAGFAVSVRLTATKPLYDPLVLASAATDYTLYPAPGVPEMRNNVDGTTQISVGLQVLGGTDAPQNAAGDPLCCFFTTQWFRGTVLVSSSDRYTPQAADVGSFLTKKVRFTYPGYLPVTVSVTSNTPVVKGTYAAGHTSTSTSLTMKLTASPPNEVYQSYPSLKFTGPAGFTYTYQWMRDGAPIVGATTATYQQTAAADRGHTIWATVTLLRAGYENLVTETPHIYSTIDTEIPASITDSTPVVGDVLTIDPGMCSTNAHTSTFPCDSATPSYQWYVGATAVPSAQGGGGATFTVPATAVGKPISVLVSYPTPEYFTTPVRTAETDPVAAS